jgi:hypothetical protein
LLHKKIHGRFDIEDVQANVKGLIAFSAIWLVCVVAVWLYKQVSVTATKE